MDPLTGIFEYAESQLLTAAERRVYKSLSYELQNQLICQLVSGIGKTQQLVQSVLQLAATTTSSIERDRLFVHLAIDEDAKTTTILSRMNDLKEKGLFDEFVQRVAPKTKQYHSRDKIISIFELFYKEVYERKLQITHEYSHAIEQEKLREDSLLVQAYNKIQNCRHYHSIAQFCEQYISLDSKNGNYIKCLFLRLTNQISFDFAKSFNDIERLNLVKTLFRIIHPNKLETRSFYTELDIDAFISQVYSLKERAGEEMLSYYFQSLRQSKEFELDEMLRGLTLLNQAVPKSSFSQFLDKWEQTNFNWENLFVLLEENVDKTEFDIVDKPDELENCINRFKNDPLVLHRLNDQDLELIKGQYLIVREYCKKFYDYNFNKLIATAHEIREKANQSELEIKDRLALIALGRLAIFIHFGIYPYCTQVLALLGTICRKNSRQAQIKTGEGKSTIVTLWAFINAMECQSVDINTPARYLAIRDQKKYESFFKRSGIQTSNICHDTKKKAHFRAQILYGPTFDFEFALMEDQLECSNFFKERLKVPFVKDNFDCVCVDESDSLLIDAANSGARMGFPAEVSYDWIYAPLLKFIQKISNPHTAEEFEMNKILVMFKETYKNLTELGDARKGDPQLFLEKLAYLLDDLKFQVTVEKLLDLCKKYLRDNLDQRVQVRLNQIQDDKILSWIFSADKALFHLNNGVDYVIKTQVDKKGRIQRTVQIVDIKTGRISEKSRWTGGIHEFLEVKHDISVQKESINPLSYSHAVFFKHYKFITALTGTAERFQTKQIYGIESFDVPPHKPSKRIDHPPIIVRGAKAYFSCIVQITNDTVATGRPVLILCQTINESEQLFDLFQNYKIKCQLLNEMQDELEHIVVEKAGIAGMITIATNTAGRGTDIILTEESLKNNGLMTIWSLFPDSEREELQGIGRGGRQGQPGSSIMIIDRDSENVKKYFKSDKAEISDSELINVLREKRKINEIKEAKSKFVQAELEIYVAELTNQFYNQLGPWYEKVKDDNFLTIHAERLFNVKLRHKKEINIDHLPEKDSHISLECTAMLQKPTSSIEWKFFLSKVVLRIREMLIQRWALNFYQPLESLISHSNSNKTTKQEIDRKFLIEKNNWEKYLGRDGLGIFTYLKEITTIQL